MVDGHLAVWDGATGTILKDGGAAGYTETDPVFALTKRFGFVDNAETSVSVAAVGDGTYRFTLTSVGATWRYFRNGVLCTITGSKDVLLAGTNPPTDGIHFIYIDDTSGTLTDGAAWTLLDTKVPVAAVLYNGALTPKYWLMDERHTCLIDRKIHYYEHITEGTRLIAGGTIAGATVGGTTNAENTFSITGATIQDEDLQKALSTLADPDGTNTDYVVFYRTGASTWAWKASAMPYDAGTYIKYDAAGTQTEGQHNKYYNSYLLLTNLEGAARFAIVSGRGEFASVAEAQAENPRTFSFAGLNVTEFVLAYQITWGAKSSYAQDGKARLEATPVAINVPNVQASVALGGGDVYGPSSATDGNLAVFDGTSGKLIRDGGAPGTGGGVTLTAHVQDLGAGRRSGTFTITGLVGLVAGKNVIVVHTPAAVSSKGDARDEFELDPVFATGYVTGATTIQVYWWSPSVQVGNVAFAWAVSA